MNGRTGRPAAGAHGVTPGGGSGPERGAGGRRADGPASGHAGPRRGGVDVADARRASSAPAPGDGRQASSRRSVFLSNRCTSPGSIASEIGSPMRVRNSLPALAEIIVPPARTVTIVASPSSSIE